MKKEIKFSPLDIPFSCSMFLEPALQKYEKVIPPLTKGVKQFVHEWNVALLEVVKQPAIRAKLGISGTKILNGTLKAKNYPVACVDYAPDVNLQSLHYAMRFASSIEFLAEKISKEKNIGFIDLGCGLSPMSCAIQAEYNIHNVYCIDFPEIIDVYSKTANLVGGFFPVAITWDEAVQLAIDKTVNTIVSMGTLHYMDIKEQVNRLKFINSAFSHFMIEVKYDANTQKENIFSLKELQKLKIDVKDTETLEIRMIKNSRRYLRKFLHAVPNKKHFIQKERSLFLSR